ncbi:tyrosine-type recombinase/integrase [Halorubrum xinjiangense]|uniref:tyrosine-type recombinase/integrase n=1 Tax=Halorubrum xinjiangense TaxID=261291 RepID=UPI003C6F5038
MSTDEIEPIDVQTAVDLYLDDREDELAEWTYYSHSSRLGHFVRYCDRVADVTELREVDGKTLYEYRVWRRDEGELNPVTVKTQMDSLRVFIRWCEGVFVRQDLSDLVRSPDLDAEANVRDEMIEVDRAKEILQHLKKYEYASLGHVTLHLLWHTGVRIGALHALDVDDYLRDEQQLEVRHRPDTETPIKNKDNGERNVNISGDTCELLDDWLDVRPDHEDDYGREPLLTTSAGGGRVHTTTLRTECHKWTRPCAIGIDCPHERDPDDCEATSYDAAYTCPSSMSAHPFRRGAFTHWLRNDWPEEVVSDRGNVGIETLRKHYDERTEVERAEARRDWLDKLDDDFDDNI